MNFTELAGGPDSSVLDESLKGWLETEYGRRRYRRWQIDERGVVKYLDAQQPCLVRNISPAGACVEFAFSNELAVSDKVTMQLDGTVPMVAVIRSAIADKLGLAFLHGIRGKQGLAKWLTLEENTRRVHRRKNISCPATLYVNKRAYPCIAQNISRGGVKIRGGEFGPLNLGAEVSLEFDGIGPIRGKIRYKVNIAMGIDFDHTPDTLNDLIDWMR